jgi:hypothetical protein
MNKNKINCVNLNIKTKKKNLTKNVPLTWKMPRGITVETSAATDQRIRVETTLREVLDESGPHHGRRTSNRP